MKPNLPSLGLYVLIAIFVHPETCIPGDQPVGDAIIGTSEFRYQSGQKDSREVSEALALFGAKYKAVVLSAKYLTHKTLLEPLGKKQMEIFCLVADEIDVEIVEQKHGERDGTYDVRIRYEVKVSDFVRSEIKDLALENEESHFSWDQEMEQRVADTISPGQELSRAYRYLRKDQSRIAIIYLDHLSKKYPNWGDVYFARAIGFYIMNDTQKMTNDLKKACALSNLEACDDLDALNQNQGKVLELR